MKKKRQNGTFHESVFRFLIWPPEIPFLVPFSTQKMRKMCFFYFILNVKVVKWCRRKWNNHNLMFIYHIQCQNMPKIQWNSSNDQKLKICRIASLCRPDPRTHQPPEPPAQTSKLATGFLQVKRSWAKRDSRVLCLKICFKCCLHSAHMECFIPFPIMCSLPCSNPFMLLRKYFSLLLSFLPLPPPPCSRVLAAALSQLAPLGAGLPLHHTKASGHSEWA